MYFAPADLASLTQASGVEPRRIEARRELGVFGDRQLVVVHHPLALAHERIDPPVDKEPELGVFKPAPGLVVDFACRRGLIGRLRDNIADARKQNQRQDQADDAWSTRPVVGRFPNRSRSTHGSRSFDFRTGPEPAPPVQGVRRLPSAYDRRFARRCQARAGGRFGDSLTAGMMACGDRSRSAQMLSLTNLQRHEGISADANDLAGWTIDGPDSRRLESFAEPAPAGRLGKLATRATG